MASQAEADSYWCLCKLLDGIQDHYTYAQPGIQRTVFHLKELVRRIDEPVARHLDEEAVDFLQFSFRRACLLPNPASPARHAAGGSLRLFFGHRKPTSVHLWSSSVSNLILLQVKLS